MVSPVLAKTTKVKNNFIKFSEMIVQKVFKIRKKIVNVYAVKVEGEKFTIRNLFLRTFFFLSSTADSFGTSLEFAAFGNGRYAKHSRASAFCFLFFFFVFLSTTMVFATVRTHFPRKNTHLYRISNSRNNRITRLKLA